MGRTAHGGDRVALPEAAATFCLACGAIHIGGVRLDTDLAA
jgi:hypothetical protein